MADVAKKRATYQDVLDAPADVTAELLHGELHLQPRPRRRHLRSASALGGFLYGGFDAGTHGPGGWIILAEPELHLGAEPDILVPDLGGWRQDRYPGDDDDDDAFFTLAPDWVAEVLSTGTARIDRTKKMPIYAREKVAHVWIVDPRDRTVEVYRLLDDRYVLATTWSGEEGEATEGQTAPAVLEPFRELPIPPHAFWGRRRKAPR